MIAPKKKGERTQKAVVTVKAAFFTQSSHIRPCPSPDKLTEGV